MSQLAPSSSGLSLRELLPEGQFIGTPDVQVRSCCGRWTECEPDDLYVAIVDNDGDGHDHVAEAMKKGASAFVSERLLAIDRPQCIVTDSRPAYGRICHALAGNPSSRINTIGVTGSVGKTMTCHLIGAILQQAEESTGLLTSLESYDGLAPGRELEIVPPRWAAQMSRMVCDDLRHAVLEIPSSALAQHRLAGMGLDVAVLTNIRREHLELHGTAENYRASKMRLFDFLKPTGVAVVNADDPATHALLDQLPCPTLTVGVREAAEVTGQVVETTLGEQIILIRAGNQTAAVRTTLAGAHQVYNFLTAAAVGLTLGFDLPLIAQGLEKVQSLPGRLQPVSCGQDFSVFVDISQTPQQLANALHALRPLTSGKIICVATQTESQSASDREALGRILERGANQCIMTAARLGLPLDYEPYHQMLDGFRETKRGHVIPDRITAIEQALGAARRGDTVLIAGCGQLPIATIGQEQWQINDHEVCQAWLYDQAHQLSDAGPPSFRIDDFRN